MKNEKKTTFTIEKKSSVMQGKNEQRQKMVDLLTEKIEKLQKNLETKKYAVDGDITTGNALLNFLKFDSNWKFAEAKGVIEATKQVERAIASINTGKVKELFMDATALEAIYYFLSKVENKGYDSAVKYIETMLQPVSNALGSAKEDRDKLDQLIRDRGTLESAIDMGADVENEDALVKEIEEELVKEL